MTDDDIVGYIANLVRFTHEVHPRGGPERDAKIALDALRHLGFTPGMAELQQQVERLESTVRTNEECHEAERIAWLTKESPA